MTLALVPVLLLCCKPAEQRKGERTPNASPVSATPAPELDPTVVPVAVTETPKTKAWRALSEAAWSTNGAVAGKTCVALSSPNQDPDWDLVQLCWEGELSLTVNHQAEPEDLACLSLPDPGEEPKWQNSFLCQPKAQDLCLRFLKGEPAQSYPADLQCLPLPELDQAPAWVGLALCTTKSADGACPALPAQAMGDPFKEIGTLTWVQDGQVPAGKYCIQLEEGSDQHGGWHDNFLCFGQANDLIWSKSGKVAGKQCLAVGDSKEIAQWQDNFLCSDSTDYCLRYSDSGPIAGMDCTLLQEDLDAQHWSDNYLCKPNKENGCPKQAEVPTFATLPGFSWSNYWPLADKHCLQITEPGDPDAWQDNYLCMQAAPPIALEWSFTGAKSGRVCTKIWEPQDAHASQWQDNYLCAADDRLCLRWSHAGPIDGMDCLQVTESAEPPAHGWDNNFLCILKPGGTCPQ